MFFIASPCQLKCFPLVHLTLPHRSLFYPPSPNHLTRPSDPSYASVVLHVRIPSWSWQSVAPSIKKTVRSLKSPSLTSGQKKNRGGENRCHVWNWRLLHVGKWDGKIKSGKWQLRRQGSGMIYSPVFQKWWVEWKIASETLRGPQEYVGKCLSFSQILCGLPFSDIWGRAANP